MTSILIWYLNTFQKQQILHTYWQATLHSRGVNIKETRNLQFLIRHSTEGGLKIFQTIQRRDQKPQLLG